MPLCCCGGTVGCDFLCVSLLVNMVMFLPGSNSLLLGPGWVSQTGAGHSTYSCIWRLLGDLAKCKVSAVMTCVQLIDS